MTLNGQPYPAKTPLALTSLLAEAGFDPGRVAVLLNGQVVPRQQIPTTTLKNGDALEVVAFVGGG